MIHYISKIFQLSPVYSIKLIVETLISYQESIIGTKHY